MIVDQHISNLKELKDDGILVLARRTLEENDKTFGIMVSELHPYRVSLIRK